MGNQNQEYPKDPNSNSCNSCLLAAYAGLWGAASLGTYLADAALAAGCSNNSNSNSSSNGTKSQNNNDDVLLQAYTAAESKVNGEVVWGMIVPLQAIGAALSLTASALTVPLCAQLLE